MSMVKVRRDGNSAAVTIPTDDLHKAGLAIGELVTVEVDEATGRVILTPVAITPRPGRTRDDVRTIASRIIKNDREVLDALAELERNSSTAR